jgi:hypothetical protein
MKQIINYNPVIEGMISIEQTLVYDGGGLLDDPVVTKSSHEGVILSVDYWSGHKNLELHNKYLRIHYSYYDHSSGDDVKARVIIQDKSSQAYADFLKLVKDK